MCLGGIFHLNLPPIYFPDHADNMLKTETLKFILFVSLREI